MKKVMFASFVAFWASVLTTLTLAWMVPLGGSRASDREPLVYTLQQVAEHASEASCWMAIEGKVYDLTRYLPQHPAPMAMLLPWCGREATEGMRTKGYGRDHTPAAWAMLDEYLIGVLPQD